MPPQRAAPRLFCFGLGYVGRALARAVGADGWRIAGTVREPGAREELTALGIEAFAFDGTRPMADAADALAGTTHLLSTVPPDAGGDPVLVHHGADIAAVAGLGWIGHLSTTGVYGDTGGAVVDEDSPLNPTSERARRRVAAEAEWRTLAPVAAHVFRLPGIYGPGRDPFPSIRSGRARRIDRPGHLFSRIHVDDIVGVLRASMARPRPGAIYNVADDEPAAPAEVTLHACGLLGVEPPPLIPFEVAAQEMSELALSFWRDNRRVANWRLKEELGYRLLHPDYRSGLAAILAAKSSATD